MTTTKSILAKIAELETDLAALRRVAAIMNGHYSAKASAQIDKRLSKAAALRTEPRTYNSDGRHAGQRRRQAILAAELDQAQSARWTHGGGPAATATQTKRKPTKRQTKAAIAANRKATASMLRRLAKKTAPVQADYFRGRTPIAVLIRHGYIKRTGDGYERTDKAFHE